MEFIASRWKATSRELDKDLHSASELFLSLLDEGNMGNPTKQREKQHWWEFLADKLANIQAPKLITKAERLRENRAREAEYCILLGLSPALRRETIAERIRTDVENYFDRVLPRVHNRIEWEFRWRYIDAQSMRRKEHEHGLTLLTLKQNIKQGRIKKTNNQLFKFASFTTSVKDGTPEKWSKDRIAVDWP